MANLSDHNHLKAKYFRNSSSATFRKRNIKKLKFVLQGRQAGSDRKQQQLNRRKQFLCFRKHVLNFDQLTHGVHLNLTSICILLLNLEVKLSQPNQLRKNLFTVLNITTELFCCSQYYSK